MFYRVQQNERDPKQFSGWCLIISLISPCQKGGPKPNLHPRPSDLHQNVPNIIANTPGKLMVPGRSFCKIRFLAGISTLPTWAPPATN